MAEAALQERIKTAMENRGAWVVKVHQTGRGRRGVPDLIACYRGFFVAVEVKLPKGKLSSHQAHEIGRIHTSGGHAIVATSVSKVMLLFDALDQVQLLNQPELPGMEIPRQVVQLEDVAARGPVLEDVGQAQVVQMPLPTVVYPRVGW